MDEDGSLVMMSTETLVDCHRQFSSPTPEDEQPDTVAMQDSPSANSSDTTLSSVNSDAFIGNSFNSDRESDQQKMTFRVKSGRVETKSVCNLWASQCQSQGFILLI
jgi:hypothetical protein